MNQNTPVVPSFSGLSFSPTPPPVPVAPVGEKAARETRTLLDSLESPVTSPAAAKPAAAPQEETMSKSAKPKAEKKAKAEPKPKAEKKAKPAKAEKKAKAEPKPKAGATILDSGEVVRDPAALTGAANPLFVMPNMIRTVEECSSIRSDESPERNDKEFESLTANIKTLGILVPLTVAADGDDAGKYVLLDGHRRLRAANEAGLTVVPVNVVSLDGHRSGVAKLTGNEVTKIDDADVRRVLGVVTNTSRSALSEPDVVRGLRKLIELDGGNKLSDKDGNPNVAAISRLLGTKYGTTRNRTSVIVAYKDDEIARLDEAVASASQASSPVPFSWGFVHEVLTKPKKYAAFRGIVDGIAKGTSTLDDLAAMQDGGGEPAANGDADGEAEKKTPDSVKVKLNTAYFEPFGMTAALLAAPRMPAKLLVTFEVELGGETLKNLNLNGAHGRKALAAAVGHVQSTVEHALLGNAEKGDDERTRVIAESLGMLAEARDAAIGKLSNKD